MTAPIPPAEISMSRTPNALSKIAENSFTNNSSTIGAADNAARRFIPVFGSRAPNRECRICCTHNIVRVA